MSTTNRHDLIINRYLDKLRWSLRDLPPARRDSIIEGITEHIQTARATMKEETEVGIHHMLDQVGEPESIRVEAGLSPSAPSWGDRWVPWLLLLGGFVIFVGWIFGVILLWHSSTWRVSDKILGTLIWPVLFCGSIFFVGSLIGMGPPIAAIIPILGLIVVVGGPILEVIRLLYVFRMQMRETTSI